MGKKYSGFIFLLHFLEHDFKNDSSLNLADFCYVQEAKEISAFFCFKVIPHQAAEIS